MLEIKESIDVTIPKNEATTIGVAIVSKFDIPKVVTVTSSCGCTTSKPTFTITPYETYINDFTIKRAVDGNVNVGFITDGKTYPVIINVKVK